MTSKRIARTGLVPVRTFFGFASAVAALGLAAAPLPLAAEARAQSAVPALGAGQGVDDFYTARRGQPLWFAGGQPSTAAALLIETIESGDIDGVDPRKYRLKNVLKAMRAARNGDPRAVQRADMMLSQALVGFVRDIRRPSDIGVYYVDPELRPGPPSPRAILDSAAAAPSLDAHIASFGWMHPLYGQLRTAYLNRAYGSETERRLLLVNLERARELPAGPRRHVLVNSAAQRLYMYENGEVVGSMRVVVGKPKNPTPMMAALIRYTALNPYWNVPPDLAAERIAPNVVKEGLGYLRSRGYQLLSDWSDKPKILDPKTIDWQAVAESKVEVRIRQLPGPSNSMGRMKFMFPNREGVYLHDTPDKELLSEASRLFSGGCVRLEDAPRLARWLYGNPLSTKGAKTEQKVPLDNPVPVFLTYLTAVPSGSSVAWFDDIYGRDAVRTAQLAAGARFASSR